MTSPRLYAATRKGLFILERSASGAWAIADVAFLGQNLPMVLPDAQSGSVFAAINHGHFGNKLQRSRDRGRNWQECAVPAYPPLPPDAKPQVDQMGRTIPSTLQLIWSLERGSPGNPGSLWCGTIPGGLFRSHDAGDSWQLNEALWNKSDRLKWMGGGADYPGIHSVCVDPRDSRHVHVGVSSGGVWETRDGGQNWEARCKGMRAAYMPPEQAEEPTAQDPHRIVACPAQPDSMWIQHHNGIFRSTNAGAQWTEIKQAGPSTFGFAVVVHPTDPNTAWFVPGVSDEKRIAPQGRVVVTRTRDGGQSFDVLTRGLPQQYAYDLTYRHALDIDSAGQTLAFGTTTGSLWLSQDQGDSWQTLAEHLPPVYCVRFEK